MGGAPVTRGSIRAALAGKRKGASRRERQILELRVAPSARELFPELRARLLASRPIIAWVVKGKRQTRAPRPGVAATPVYGAPMFRNRINEKGEHV